MFKRILGVSLLAVALACASGGGSGSSMGSGSERAKPRSDPGLGDRGSRSGGVEISSKKFRSVYFDFNRSALQRRAKQDLNHNAQVLRERTNSRVEIQGNCDERGTEEYNLALGMRRADTAKRYLVDLGISPSRIDTISFGEENPSVRGHSESAWAKNRRDDFVIR